MNKKVRIQLMVDIFFVMMSIIIAIICVHAGLFESLIRSLEGWSIFGIFIAGIFFTSVFTTAPAIIILGKLALIHNPFLVAAIGGLGSIIGELLIFKWIKDRFSDDLTIMFRGMRPAQKLKKLVEIRFFRWFLFFIGGVIIASPLPDELGLVVLGLVKIDIKYFLIISYTFSGLGILIIGLIARGLL